MALNTRLPAHPDPGEVEAPEALIREARQRARRRHRRYAITTVVILVAATGGGLAARGGGSDSPPLGASQAQHPAPGALPPPRSATSWPGTQVGGDGFGIIVADPRHPRTMFGLSSEAGLFKSTDAGGTWRMLPFPRGGEGDRVDALAITPRGPRVLYAGGSTGVFASVDGGRTWRAANNGLVPDRVERSHRGLEGWIWRLTIHPLDPDLMYAHGATSSWRSTDGGDHWTRFQVGRLAIAVDPQDTRVLYAPNQQWQFRNQRFVATPVVPTEDSVVKSTDGGLSWSPSGLQLPGGLHVDRIVVNPGDPRVLFATTSRDWSFEAMHRSTDGGATWRTTSLRSGWLGEVSPDPQDPDTVYVQTWPTNDDGDSRILKSADGGDTWWPLFRQADMQAHELGLLPLDPAQPTTLYVDSNAGLLKSTDAGATWQRMRSGVASPVSSVAVDPRRPEIAYAGLDQGGVVKKARGRWHAINHGLGETGVDAVAVDPYRSGVVYAATYTGLFKTADGGQNWRRVLDPSRHWDPPSRRFAADAVTVAGPTTVYATISRGGRWFLWKSVDRGASWRRLTQKLRAGDDLSKNVDPGASSRQLGRNTLRTGDGHPLAAGASDPDTVYVAGRTGLATSTDGGATWHDAGLAGTRVTAIAVHPQLADTVYAGTTAGLFTSTNAGQTWQRVRGDLAQAHVTAVATDHETGGRVYAATEKGIFWSGNSGENWNRFDTRLPPRTFNVLAATRTGMVYAGSPNGGGIVQLRTSARAPRP